MANANEIINLKKNGLRTAFYKATVNKTAILNGVCMLKEKVEAKPGDHLVETTEIVWERTTEEDESPMVIISAEVDDFSVTITKFSVFTGDDFDLKEKNRKVIGDQPMLWAKKEDYLKALNG